MLYKYSVTAEAVKDYPTQYDKQIDNANEMYNFAKSIFNDIMNVKERFVAVYLNNANKINGYYIVGEGTTKSVNVDIKLIALNAIKTLSNAVILLHNHPSDINKPSKEDYKITQKILSALKLLDVEVLDHIIVTNQNYYSFNDNGLI